MRHLGANDEFHSGHIVFEVVMGHPWENVLDKGKCGPGLPHRFRERVREWK